MREYGKYILFTNDMNKYNKDDTIKLYYRSYI